MAEGRNQPIAANSDTSTVAAKHTAAIDRHGFTRFQTDYRGAPKVNFAPTQNGMLVLLEGRHVLDADSLAVQTLSRPVALRYTVREWKAFVGGVHDGEFDDFAEGPASDLIPIRDSKDPEGPVLVFTVSQIKPFLQALRSGKYDL